jgi:hypothetical protein
MALLIFSQFIGKLLMHLEKSQGKNGIFRRKMKFYEKYTKIRYF